MEIQQWEEGTGKDPLNVVQPNTMLPLRLQFEPKSLGRELKLICLREGHAFIQSFFKKLWDGHNSLTNCPN